MRLVFRLCTGGLLCLLAVTPRAHAQERVVPMDASILGEIVDTEGRAIPGAVVTLSGGLAQISLTVAAPRELEGGPQRVLTDARGRFVFSGLAPGSYSLEATKSGYLPGAYGRRRHGAQAQSLTIAESERRIGVRIPIWPFVAVSGTVIDEAGEPMVGFQVTAQRQTFIATRPRLSAPVATVTTDDRGVYRFDGLPPGSYVICVPTTAISLPAAMADAYAQNPTPDVRSLLASSDLRLLSAGGVSGRQVGDVIMSAGTGLPLIPSETDTVPAAYTTSCYPGAHAGNADRLVLESGTERDNVDIALRPVLTAPVSGTLVDPEGRVKNVTVRLLPSHAPTLAVDAGAETALAITDDKGAFVFPAVPHGDYTLKVLRAPTSQSPQSGAPARSTERTGWAEAPVSVDEKGVSGLTVQLRHGFRLTGRLELDGTANKPGPDLIQRFSIQLDPADGSGSRMPVALRGAIDREGRITTNEIPPGRYVVLFLAFAPDRLAMPGWEAVGATIDGRDVSHTPFDLSSDVTTLVMTLSDHAADITGTVRDAQGLPDPGASVILFPADRNRWTDRGFSTRAMRLMRASQSGGYRMGSVPPGDYVLAAIPDEEAGNWDHPEVLLAAMRTGSRISIGRDQKKTLDLVTTPLRTGGR